MNNIPKEGSDTESQKESKRMGEHIEPYPAKKRMLLKDSPQKIKEEGREIMAIRGLLDKQVVEIIQQWKKGVHDQDTSNGNGQILDSMVGGCKNQ